MSPEAALNKALDCEEHIDHARIRNDLREVAAWERMRERWLAKAVELECLAKPPQ